ncbi:hypothetical protein WIW50_05155 [Flavobacteriaceae bacterium 3-367]
MKKIVIALACTLVGLSLQAQKVIEKNIAYQDQHIDVDLKFAEHIELKTWDKDEVYFKAHLSAEEEQFLEYYELKIDESSSQILIVSKAEPVFKKFREAYDKDNPDRKKRHYYCGYEYEFNYTLYVPKNASFSLSSINGSLVSEVVEGDFTAELINGDIEIKTYAGNLDLSTINGEIDLKMRNTKVVAETIHGNIYADEKLNFQSTDRHVGQKVEGSFDRAAHRLRLNTINGNMYLRL